MNPSVRPYSFALWFLLPIWLLIVLIQFPPHSVDLSISQLFFTDGTWPWKSNYFFENVLHKDIKWVSVFALLAYVFWNLRYVQRSLNDDHHLNRKRLWYVLSAVILSLGMVWLLKQTTGVSCPWSVVQFGGKMPQLDPSISITFQPGKCWPGGHAGTGFCLFALYFVFRDQYPKLARVTLLLVITFGLLCSITRVMQGAHFVSHNLVTFLLDWLVSASLYILFFDCSGIRTRLSQMLNFSLVKRNMMTALLWTLIYSAPFWTSLVKGAGNDSSMISSTLYMVSVLIVSFFFISLSVLELISLLPINIQRFVLGLLTVCGSLSFVCYELYGTIMTPDMIRNFLETNSAEASQYFSWSSLGLSCLMMAPGCFLFMNQSNEQKRWANHFQKVAAFAASILLGALLLLGQLQPFSATMRNDKTLRYLIAPFNVVYSTGSTLLRDQSTDRQHKKQIVDANPKATIEPSRPTVFVLVIGETARSDNWQLAGYGRNTTPLLAKDGVISFPKVQACGTSTDVSLPCMLSRIGRRDYDRNRILSEESLPSLLKRAGFEVTWVDNQSGSKGTSSGVKTVYLKDQVIDSINEQCMDYLFVKDLKQRLSAASNHRPQVLIYHMMGSHGPAYNVRSESQDKVFGPVCTDSSFRTCSPASIVNAYDSSIHYTDRVLNGLLSVLKSNKNIDGGLIYISDHGESLGEAGLYLHGAPYYFAPEGQKVVPMVMWFSENFLKDYSVSETNLMKATKKTNIMHDHLYHTVLGLLKVKSTTYDRQWDLSAKAN